MNLSCRRAVAAVISGSWHGVSRVKVRSETWHVVPRVEVRSES